MEPISESQSPRARRGLWLGLSVVFALVGAVVAEAETLRVAWPPFVVSGGCVLLSFSSLRWQPFSISSVAAGVGTLTVLGAALPSDAPPATVLVSREVIVDRYAGPNEERPGTSERYVLLQRRSGSGAEFLRSAVAWEWVRDGNPREVDVTRQSGRILRVALPDGSAAVTFDPEPSAELTWTAGIFVVVIVAFLWENRQELT